MAVKKSSDIKKRKPKPSSEYSESEEKSVKKSKKSKSSSSLKVVEKKKPKAKKEKQYGAFKEDYKDTEVIVIREIDDAGEANTDVFHIASMGKRKWSIILSVIDQIEEILETMDDG